MKKKKNRFSPFFLFFFQLTASLYCHPVLYRFIALQQPRNDFAGFHSGGWNTVAPLKYRTTGDDRFIGVLIFLTQFRGSRFFFPPVCSTRGKWNFPCQSCEPGNKRRGEGGIVGVVRRVFLTRLIGEVGGWRRDENSGATEWSGLWDCCSLFLCTFIFFCFVFFLGNKSTFMFKSLVEIEFRDEKRGVLERDFFLIEEILIEKFWKEIFSNMDLFSCFHLVNLCLIDWNWIIWKYEMWNETFENLRRVFYFYNRYFIFSKSKFCAFYIIRNIALFV